MAEKMALLIIAFGLFCHFISTVYSLTAFSLWRYSGKKVWAKNCWRSFSLFCSSLAAVAIAYAYLMGGGPTEEVLHPVVLGAASY